MTDPRESQRAAFLAASTCAGWHRQPMPADASARHFERLAGPAGATAILMDADPATGERLGPFLAIGRHLAAAGLAAPAILAADEGAGLAIVEDLGPRHFADWLAERPQDSTLLYGAAVDVLARLQTVPLPADLPALSPIRAAAMIAPLFEWYVPEPDARWQAHVTGLLQEALFAHAPVAKTLSLRDFHAENLIWRPDLTATDRVGLIDFQDAVAAPPEYDLASLLRDARRDVDRTLRVTMTDRFAKLTGRPFDAVHTAASVLAVQRNLRILGIFARLAGRDGKRRYLQFIPRVWGLVMDDLEHPALTALGRVIGTALPPPDAAHLVRIAP